MRIERINDNQIRCTLNKRDLAERHLKISELAYGSDKAKKLFRDMMEQAHMDYGFEADDIPLMIEAIPTSRDSIVLVITKVDNPEELEERFSPFRSFSRDEDNTDEEDDDDFYDSDTEDYDDEDDDSAFDDEEDDEEFDNDLFHSFEQLHEILEIMRILFPLFHLWQMLPVRYTRSIKAKAVSGKTRKIRPFILSCQSRKCRTA